MAFNRPPRATLRWRDIAPDEEFHAALVTLRGGSAARAGVAAHRHDFAEMLFALSGRGRHLINEAWVPWEEGSLAFVRPEDCHALQAAPDDTLRFINVAFPMPSWAAFVQAAGLEAAARAWENAPRMPHIVVVGPARREAVRDAFGRALRAFQEQPSRLELCRFWTAALAPLLEDAPPAGDPADEPPWLTRVCHAMQDKRHLQAGFRRMVALSGVSAAHLARTLRARRGQTPTEFINALRLRRAATLLATTPLGILEIADECGFENAAYFYRLFRRAYGCAPRAFRLRAQQSVAPH